MEDNLGCILNGHRPVDFAVRHTGTGRYTSDCKWCHKIIELQVGTDEKGGRRMETSENLGCLLKGHRHGNIHIELRDSRYPRWISRCMNCQGRIELLRPGQLEPTPEWVLVGPVATYRGLTRKPNTNLDTRPEDGHR